MTNRPPPSLGSYRPPPDERPRTGRSQRPGRRDDRREARQEQDDSAFERELFESDQPGQGRGPDGRSLPRIVTERVRTIDAERMSTSRSRRRPAAREPEPTESRGLLRWALFGLFGVVAFVAVAAVAAMALVPTSLIQDQLRAAVKAQTGRDLIIRGKASLSLLPKPTVTVRDVTLSGPPGMGAGPLITVGEIEVAVQILPLLIHDVTVDRLVLRNPVIDLRIDAQGRRNWDFAATAPLVRYAQAKPAAGGRQSTDELPKELRDFVRGSTDASAAGGESGPTPRRLRLADLSLGNVAIENGTLRYRDDRGGVDETATALAAQVSLVNLAQPLDAKADFVWRGEPVTGTAQVAPVRALIEGGKVQVRVKATAQPFALSFDGTITPGPSPDIDGHLIAAAASLERLARWTRQPIAGSMSGSLAIDARLKQTATGIALSDAKLAFGPHRGDGALSIDLRGQKPVLTGTLHVAMLDLNVVQALAETRVREVAGGRVSADESAGPPKSIEDILAESQAQGAAPPAVQPAAPAGSTTAGSTQGSQTGKTRDWSDAPLNVALLALGDADIRLTFDGVAWQQLRTGAGQLVFALKSRVAKVTLDDVQLYDGHARGFVTLDSSSGDMAIAGNLVSDGIAMLPFLQGLGSFDWLAGKGRTAVAVAGRGATERQIVSSLNGRADISVSDGALLGLNLSSILNGLSRGKPVSFERSATEKTPFTAFTASTQIANGIARSTDLHIASSDVQATGEGTIDLGQRTMDYLLHAKVNLGGQPLDIPIKVEGSIDRPTVTPQLGAMIRDPARASQTLGALANTPVGREVQDTVRGALSGDPAARAKARSFFEQLLK